VKSWEGAFVTVNGEGWHFHRCLRCHQRLSGRNRLGFGPECQRAWPEAERRAFRERALEADRERYRAEVLALGFKVRRTVG
jgi:hypothetical protein